MHNTPAEPRDRKDGWCWEKQKRFLELLAETGSVTHAATTLGMSPSSAYRLRHRLGKPFAEAWKRAARVAYRGLRESAMQRAIAGTRVPLYNRGEIVGERTVHDERLVMFLLKTRGARRFGKEDYVADAKFDETIADLFALDQELLDQIGATVPEQMDTVGAWTRLEEIGEKADRVAEWLEEEHAMITEELERRRRAAAAAAKAAANKG